MIIPFYGHDRELRTCLRAIASQTLPLDLFEVLVIDNNIISTLNSSEFELENLRILHEPTPGSYAARNKGLGMAKGDIIAFTDADCIPAKDWLERAANYFMTSDDMGCIGGNVKMFFSGAKPSAVELFDSLTSINQSKFISRKRFAATANFFVPRKFFDAVGTFDGSLKSGGDFEWCQRARLLGFEITYKEDVQVQHPTRKSLSLIITKARRTIGGRVASNRLGYDVGARNVSSWREKGSYLKYVWHHHGMKILFAFCSVAFCVRLAKFVEQIRLLFFTEIRS